MSRMFACLLAEKGKSKQRYIINVCRERKRKTKSTNILCSDGPMSPKTVLSPNPNHVQPRALIANAPCLLVD